MTQPCSAHADCQRSERFVLLALAAVVLVRLLTLGLYPLTDTTEARYAEVARKMVTLGDWVTLWYEPGVPFWAKPPLSTWLTAASFKVFGVNEFAARLPHFLLAVAVGWLVWDWLRLRNRRQALLGVAMLCGAILFLVSAGAVMTDMALTLGTTMAMRGLWLSMFGAQERRGFAYKLAFGGLAIGLLAKGPVALVLTGVPFGVWAMATRNVGLAWRSIPWGRGALVTAAVAVPWYIAAESATPGFLNYFLVGEHWQRFTTPGWLGDRYGKAHDFARGTIWPFAAFAFMPWTVLLPLLAIGRNNATPALPKEHAFRIYLLCWALASCFFFVLARNILWTYALPGIPAAAMLGAAWLCDDRRVGLINGAVALGIVIAALSLFGVMVQREQTSSWKSTKELVQAFNTSAPGGQTLWFVGPLPYSASFYSAGQARSLNLAELKRIGATQRVFLGMSTSQLNALDVGLRSQFRVEAQCGLYVLLERSPEVHVAGMGPAPCGPGKLPRSCEQSAAAL